MIEGILGRLLAFILFVGVICVAVVLGGSYYVKNRLATQDVILNEGTFVIPKGSGAQRVIGALQDEGFISSDAMFPPSDGLVLTLATKAKFIEPQIKAGEYEIPMGLSLKGLMDYLSDSSNTIQHQITFPEGWRSAQILERIKANPILVGNVPDVLPEGRYLTDTWSFERGETRQDVLNRMASAQNELLNSLWETRAPDLPFNNKDEAVILASIVERETAKPEERATVASVYINRLKQGMKLDADPTVAYGVSKFGSDEPLLRSDLENKSNPYNTYIHKGLPPGPIANPGRGAIEAVLNPAETEYLFFVADGTGGHVFAKTYKEHQNNVAEWRRIQANQ
ncbi:MAG: endolytic transglycosylase MltG [Alphaproteobacteria bacterium]